jgi:hypothetical protein
LSALRRRTKLPGDGTLENATLSAGSALIASALPSSQPLIRAERCPGGERHITISVDSTPIIDANAKLPGRHRL